MTQSSKNKTYSAEDFERYHAGKMPAAEMHALEKAAMEDPFLADALQGYQFTPHPLQDIEKIKERLKANSTSQKAVPFIFRNYNWLKAAAILIVIAGSSWLAFQMGNPDRNEMAADQKIENVVQKPQQNAATTPTDSAITSTGPEMENRIAKSNDNTIKNPNKTTEKTPAENSVASVNVPRREENIANENPTKDQFYYTTPANNKVVNSRNANNPQPQLNNNQQAGYHNSQATPSVVNNNANARRQEESFIAPRRNDSISETVASMDEKRGDTVRNLNIVLQPTNEGLSEVVVVSPGKKTAKKAAVQQVIVDTLEPTVGWVKFDEYIANNLNYPEEIKTKQTLPGEVELIFDINKEGEPVNIAVTKSLCAKCDEEAIRLLKEGPKWKKKKNKKGKVTIRF